ncbi:MAG: VanW family protein [Acidimicrobiales bacterium]|nr:VanW family protein [Acidimicrobiales bacterium]
MRNALLAVAAVVAAVFAGWVLDDKVLGGDIARNTSIAGVDVGRLDIDEAAELLTDGRLTDRPIELRHDTNSLTITAAELGVMVDAELALTDAAEQPDLIAQPIRWIGSLFGNRSFDVRYTIDVDVLGEVVAGSDSIFDLDFGLPQLELVNGRFVEADVASSPIVDADELRDLVLDAAITGGNGTAVIEIPITGSEAVDRGADELIAEAHRLTKNGIALRVPGIITQRRVSQSALRSWLVFGGTIDEPTISLDEQLAQSTVEALFIDYGEAGDEPTFTIDDVGRVRIVGSSPGAVCCTLDTPERILAGMEAGERIVELRPREDPGVRGIEWAKSLGIVEVIGEFTTNYQPNQTRNINIQRIAELTQGAVIEPGGEFSINDYVGRRTRENGFVDAGVISNGVFTTSVGGGISQYATTLFNAAFFAGLDFGDYQSHSIYISRYPYGREATVNFPNVDLEILNTTPYGVLLWPTTDETSITVTLYGTKWVEGAQTGQTERRQGVSCIRVTTERTRTYLEDGRTEIDTVFARYRPEGVRCDGSPSDPADRTTTTTSTVPPATTVP